MVKWLGPLLCTEEVPGSNISLASGCLDLAISCFSSFRRSKCLKLVHSHIFFFYILSISLFIIHAIQMTYYIILEIESIVTYKNNKLKTIYCRCSTICNLYGFLFKSMYREGLPYFKCTVGTTTFSSVGTGYFPRFKTNGTLSLSFSCI